MSVSINIDKVVKKYGDTAVSYTHLDVYKRQALSCFPFFSQSILAPALNDGIR